MKAISIRQPWAWMILHAGKDIENRDWYTGYRGRVLVHAPKGMTQEEWSDAWDFAQGSGATARKPMEANITMSNIERGGIVGSVEIVDCVQAHPSRWFVGRYGFVLRNPIALQFRPFAGKLGFFDVPDLPTASVRQSGGDT